MSIKPVLVPDHDAASLRKLMDHFAEASTGPTKRQLNESRAAVAAAKKTFAESSGAQVDMKDKKCTACKKGTYQETGQHDDMDGVLHCNKCNREVKRHQSAASKKKNVSESIEFPSALWLRSNMNLNNDQAHHLLHNFAKQIAAQRGLQDKIQKIESLAQQAAMSSGNHTEAGAKFEQLLKKYLDQSVSESLNEFLAPDGSNYGGDGGGDDEPRQYRVIITLYDDSSADDETAERRIGITVTATSEQAACDQAETMLLKSPRYDGSRITNVTAKPVGEPDMTEGSKPDPAKAKLGRLINRYFGQIYNYGDGDDSLNYLDDNAPLWNSLFDKHDGDIDTIIANEPADVLKKAALELKNVAADLKYELDEKLGANRPKLGTGHDTGKSIRKWRKTRGFDESEMEEGLKQKLAGAALAGAMALGAGGAQAQTTDKYDPDWNAHSMTHHMRADVSSTKGMNSADPSQDVNDFQKRIQKVSGPNAKGEYKVVVLQNGDIVSHYVTKTPPPGWLYKESMNEKDDKSFELEEGWKQKVGAAALAGAAALGAGGAQAQSTDRFDPAWGTSGYNTSIRSDVSSNKSMNTADPSKDTNDFQKRIQSVTGPNAKGEYKVVVMQGHDIVSHYVTKTPPPEWLYKEDAESKTDEGVIDNIKNTVRAANYDRLARRSNSQAVAGGGFAPPAQFKSLSAKGDQRAQKAQDIRKGSAEQVDEIDMGLVGDAVAGAAMGLGSVGLGSYIGHKIGNKIGQKFIDRSNRKEAERQAKYDREEWRSHRSEIDELDKSTLGSYIKKSSADATQRQSKITGHNEFQKGARTMAGAVYGDKVQRFPDREDPKIAQRQAGVGRAVDRLTAQEIDEKSESIRHANNPHDHRAIKKFDEQVGESQDPIEQLRADIKRFSR